jgi:lipoate-protein ligase A
MSAMTTTPSTPWRRLPFSTEPMGRQLALSEAVLAQLAATGRPTLRWYIPAEPALVLGNGQKPGLADMSACQAAGVSVFRRTSGGAAVLVNADLLSLDVAIPADHALATSDIVRAYQWIGDLWTKALRTLGAARAHSLSTDEARLAARPAQDDPVRLACFGTLSPWEVVMGRRKLVGLCQVRRRPGALYQVGLHLRFDPKALGALLDLNHNARKTLGTRLHNGVVALDEAAGRPIAAEMVIAILEQTLTDTLGAALAEADYTQAEVLDANRIQRERFLPFA